MRRFKRSSLAACLPRARTIRLASRLAEYGSGVPADLVRQGTLTLGGRVQVDEHGPGAVAANAELRRRHPDQKMEPLRSAEPALSDTERE